MFKKKKKIKINYEEEIAVATSKEEKDVVSKDVVEDIQEVNIVDDEYKFEAVKSEKLVVGKYTFFDNDPTTECAVDEKDDEDEIVVALTKKKEVKEEIEEEIEETVEEPDDEIIAEVTEDDIDEDSGEDVDEDIDEDVEEDIDEDTNEELDSEFKDKNIEAFFEESKKSNKKLKEKPKKEKRKSKRSEKREREFTNIKDQKVFIFRNKRYTKVDDFIKYLNANYLDIDVISQEVLDDENFFGWLSKRSGIFDDSIKQFKEIKEKIEKK